MSNPPKNSQFFEVLAIEVAGGCTVKDSAKTVGCSLDHAYALSRTDAFKARVNQLRDEIVSSAVGRLATLADEAVTTLERNMKARGLDAGQIANRKLQLTAAKESLRIFTSLSNDVELRQRLDRIEQRLHQEGKSRE